MYSEGTGKDTLADAVVFLTPVGLLITDVYLLSHFGGQITR